MKRRASPLIAALLLCLLAGLTVAPPARAREHAEWWDAAWRRRTLVRVREDPRRATAARAWLHLPPDADSGGRDLRVIAPDGDPVRFGVAHRTPEGRYLLGFELRGPHRTYAIYYDNPLAGPVEQTLPARGLIHETRAIPEDARPGTWEEARRTIARAAPAWGADYRPRVFDAYNPFGPQEDYIGIYRGYIDCPESGTYRFATVSDHSSFLLVNGQLVAQAPAGGNLGRARRGEYSGSIELRRGLHRFEYVHFAFGGPARAVAAWIPPGEDWWRVIPASAFPMPAAAETYESQRRDRRVCADFEFEPLRYAEASRAEMTEVGFRSLSTAIGEIIRDYRWEFGDGQTSSAAAPEHVYLAAGAYPVRLTVTCTGGRTASVAKKVRVEPIRDDLDFSLSRLEGFMQRARGYRLGRLTTAGLLGAWELFRHMEERDLSFEAARLLDERRDELSPEQLHEVAMHLGAHYQTRERRVETAEEYFRLARDAVPQGDRARRLNARFALAEHYLEHRDDPERARQELVALRTDFAGPDRRRLREALIRIGDTWRRQGEAANALQAYREAEDEAAYAPDRPAALITGAAFQQVEAHLRRGEADSAIERLDELLWQFPTMRLEGRPALLRARAEMVRGDFREARRYAEAYLRVGTDPNHVPAVRIEAAEACLEMGLLEDAEAHFRAVLEEHPASPEVAEAEDGLRRLGL